MGCLDPGRIRLAEMEQILEMLVHRINQTVENGPQHEQCCDQEKCEGHVHAVRQSKDAFFICACGGCGLSKCRHKSEWTMAKRGLYRQAERNNSVGNSV